MAVCLKIRLYSFVAFMKLMNIKIKLNITDLPLFDTILKNL